MPDNWQDVEDPQGRLRKGQVIRWGHADPGACDMKVIALCAPMGLYRRPVRDDDESPEGRMAREFGLPDVPCDADHPEAVYEPEKLMVDFRYLKSGARTTGQAIHMVVVKENS